MVASATFKNTEWSYYLCFWRIKLGGQGEGGREIVYVHTQTHVQKNPPHAPTKQTKSPNLSTFQWIKNSAEVTLQKNFRSESNPSFKNQPANYNNKIPITEEKTPHKTPKHPGHLQNKKLNQVKVNLMPSSFLLQLMCVYSREHSEALET